MTRIVLVAAVCAVLAGCNSETPTSPAPGGLNGLPPSSIPSVLLLRCEPVGQDVACSAFEVITLTVGTSLRDLTATAQWTATPADMVQMVAPGRFRPLRAGEVNIAAQSGEELQPLLPSRFLVAPGADARPLAVLMLLVRSGNGAPLEGAVVQVLDGHAAGATCTTTFGMCQIESVMPSETFNVRATRDGYQTQTVTHQGIPLRAPPPAVFLTISLTRQ